MNKNTITIGLVGNPNSGKTTIFNALTGSRQKVANWSGVTVEKREGRINYKGYAINIVDLPGTYSLSSYSIEEIITRDFIIGKFDNPVFHGRHGWGKGHGGGRRGHKHGQSHSGGKRDIMPETGRSAEGPDVIINVVDAGNLERNLYLTTQLIEMNAKTIIALNMYDEAESKGYLINTDVLSTLFGMDIVKTVAIKSIGIDRLLDAAIAIFQKKSKKIRHLHIGYGPDIEKEIKNIQNTIWHDEHIGEKYSTRWLAIRLLERDEDAEIKLRKYDNFQPVEEQVKKSRLKLEKKYKDNIETVLTDMRYGFISGALKEAIKKTAPRRRDFSEEIDKFILNRFLAFPVLIIFIWLLFQLTFSLGRYPMDLIDRGVLLLTSFLNKALPEGLIRDLIVDGILGGIGGIIVFLPNILILFLGISFMEDTGYMARAAFKMDRIMHTIGLHGKSFISIVMGFGCNVPAIMSTRALENKRDRILTILINPFMSCSARLPVYLLFAGTFFPDHAGSVIMSLYLTGILFAFLSAKLFQVLFFRGQSMPFVMELPPYRIPTLKTTLLHMWDRGYIYLRKIGGIILFLSVIIWILSTFPKSGKIEEEYSDKLNKININYEAEKDRLKKQAANNENMHEVYLKYKKEIADLKIRKKSDEINYSVIGRFGNLIYPLVKPLGFNQEMGISLITGFVAKEIVVSTMGVLYHASESDDEKELKPLHEALKDEEHGITPLIAFTFMLFVLLYVPCMGTVVVIGREAGWRWAVFSTVYQIILSWVICFVFFNLGKFLGF